jgi:NAD+ diphosphatase
MDGTEIVAFAGSGLDRAAMLRGDGARLEALRAEGRVLPVWRGKPLLTDAGGLGWITAGAALVAGRGTLFLGLDDGMPRFATDVSDCEPADAAAAGGFLDTSVQRHPDLPEDHDFGDLRGAMTRLTAREAELAATARAILGWHATHGFCAACGAASQMAEGGWQRLCPSCGMRHFPRTDPVVIMLITRGNRALVGRSPGWPEAMYSCLAGFVEPGETVEAAVRREVAEETGVPVGRVRYLSSQPWPFPSSLMLGCHGVALDDRLTIDPAEIEDALWISREETVEVLADAHPRIRPPRRGAIARQLLRMWVADRME